jgi:uncharacterized membrane protein HdeD (DUF308 family)
MMIFGFGRENKVSGLIKALVAIAFGAYLIITKANAMELVVQIIAGAIMLMGAFSFLLGLRFPAMQIMAGSSLFGILAGGLLFVFAGPISAVLRYIIGGFLFLSGGSQIFSLLRARGSLRFGLLSFTLPVLMVLGGCLFFSEELIGNDIMGLMVGVAIIMYGVSKLMTVLRLNGLLNQKTRTQRKSSEPRKSQAGKWEKLDDGSIKDVDYEKVD